MMIMMIMMIRVMIKVKIMTINYCLEVLQTGQLSAWISTVAGRGLSAVLAGHSETHRAHGASVEEQHPELTLAPSLQLPAVQCW